MRIFVSAFIGRPNLGDELIFACLLARLRDMGAEVACTSVQPEQTEAKFGVQAVFWNDPRSIAREVKRSDSVILGGGGLVQEMTSVWCVPINLYAMTCARIFGKLRCAVGLGVDRIRLPQNRAIVRFALGGAVVAVRDAPSQANLADLGVLSDVAADLAFDCAPPPETTPDDAIAVSLRAFRAGNGSALLPASSKKGLPPASYIMALRDALAEIAAAGHELRFFAFESPEDARLHEAVVDGIPGCTLNEASETTVVGDFASCRAAISTRYHGGIVATLAGRPSVLIGYAPKVASLAKELGSSGCLVPNEPAALASIPARLAAVLDDVAAVRAARDSLRQRGGNNYRVWERLAALGVHQSR